ncbi:hypothetical protein AB1L30_01575 [Bremerella sp. JC817]|uniref:hypothetical protein n=1 Tax=Bremerella sp. JC817 TaxID=3231756 RepID=UPI003457AC9E
MVKHSSLSAEEIVLASHGLGLQLGQDVHQDHGLGLQLGQDVRQDHGSNLQFGRDVHQGVKTIYSEYQQAKRELSEGNLRLVVSIASRLEEL